MKRVAPVALLLALLWGCGPKESAPTETAGTRTERRASTPRTKTSSTSARAKTSKAKTPKRKKGTLAKGSVVQVQVVGVSDGDTVTLLTDKNTEVRMRLNGIDAPESKQSFGARAKERLSDLIYGKTVTAKIDGTDRYGRALGEITYGGASVNDRMVRDGLAWWYRQYAKKDTDLERFETEARNARRGLWSEPNPQEPWAWRKERR